MIIDVSEHNGKLNWEKLKPEIEGAILRCGFGSDYKAQDDKQFSRNASECERLGIPYGVYIYSYANTTSKAVSEAKHVKRLIEGKKLSFPVFYDLEEEKYSKYAKSMAQTFLKEMREIPCGIYANVNWWKNYLGGVSCDLKWVAYWGKTQPSISGMVLWQYTDNGKVAGISGFDCNKNISLKPQPEPSPAPEPSPEPQPQPEPENKNAGIWKITAQHGLRLRTSPNTNSSTNIICLMPCGSDAFSYDGETEGNWLKVRYKGKTGWCSMSYLKKYANRAKDKAGTYIITAHSGLRMRSTPDTSYNQNIITVMSYDSKCASEGFYKDGWLYVSQSGKSGWSSTDYLKKV